MKKYKYVYLFLLVTCLIIGLGSVTATDINTTTDTQKTVTDTNTQNTIKTIQNTAQTQENDDNNKACKEIVKTNTKIKENKTQETKQKIKQIQTNNNNQKRNTTKSVKQNIINVSDYSSLKQAIEWGASQETGLTTINLIEGTYINTETIKLETRGCVITINGNNQIIHGNQKRFLDIHDLKHIVKINDLIITNCSDNDGGAIYNHGNLTISNSNITDNTATRGGVIYNTGYLTIINTTLNNNRATQGGVIYTNGDGNVFGNGNLTLINSTLTNNIAEYGGVIYNDNGNITIQNTNTINNTATQGGVIYNQGNIRIENTNMTSNTATENGGTIINNNLLELYNSILINNKVNNINGYIVSGNENTIIRNSEFYNNTDFRRDSLFNNGNKVITDNIYVGNYLETTSNTLNNVTIDLMDYNINIPLTTREVYNTVVNNGNFTVFVNGKEYKRFVVENGSSDITIPLNIFNQTVNNVIYNYTSPDNSYQPLTLNNTLTLRKHETKITINQIPDTLFDNKVNVTGTLKDVNNTSISNAIINITINNKTYNTKTNNEGEYNLITQAILGLNNITINYDGNNIYYRKQATMTFEGLRHGVVFTIANTTLDFGTIIEIPINFNITGTVRDTNGTSIPDINVTMLMEDNSQLHGVTDNNGEYILPYTIYSEEFVDAIGIRYFINRDCYDCERDSFIFGVLGIGIRGVKHNTTITLNKINDTLYDKQINITGTLQDDTINSTITNATISVTVNSKTYNTKTNNKGEYNLITQAMPGLNNITVNYNGNNTYNKAQISTTLTGLKHETNTIIDSVKGLLGKNVTFKAHVTDTNGTSINEGYVIFKVNGITLKDKNGNPIQVNVTNGTATLTTIATWGKANNTTASYSGNEKYKASKADGTINITKQNAIVNMTIQNNGLKPGQTLIAIVNVTDMDNKPVNTGNVLFKMNGKTMKYTDGSQVRINVTNGTAILHYQVPLNYSAKNYTLTAVYTGNIYNRAETTTNFTLNKRDAKINMIINSEDLKPGSTLIATVNVTDIEGFPVTTGRVAFKLNGKILKYTNGSSIKIAVENGTAKLNYTIPGNYTAKTYTLTAEFNAGNYNTVETGKNITLNKINTYIQPNNITINGNRLTVKANIINNDTQKPADERTQKVSVKLDKHTVIKEVTVQNGEIDLSTDINVKPGVHTVEIVTSGNGIYNNCRQNFTINNQTLLTDNSENLIKVTG